MKHPFKPTLLALSLGCALSGAMLAGCNRGGGDTGSSMVGGVTGSSSDTLATVGSAKVTRADLNSFLEAQGGEQALPLLIDTQLIFEALKAKSLEVSDAEVEADLARRQASDPQFAAQVAEGGPRLAFYKMQIKRELAVQKLLTADIKATDAQAKTFFEKNRVYYDQPSKTTVAMLLASTKTRADLMAAQLKAKSKTVTQLLAEQKKALDPLGARSVEDASLSPVWSQISPAVTPVTDKLPLNGVAPVQQFAPQAFGVFVVTKKTPVVKADFDKMKADAMTDYKSAEIAKKVVSAPGTKNPPFDETLRRTYASLKAQNPAATLRDTLNYINQGGANTLISGLRTAGTVQIDDATYTKVAAPYQAVPAAGAAANSAMGNAATGNAATSTTTESSATGNAATAPAAP